MKIKTEYEIEAREIPEMISGIISNMAQFYEMYKHIEKEEASKQNKSPLCEYYIDTQTHTVYKLDDLIFKLVKDGKIQPDLTK